MEGLNRFYCNDNFSEELELSGEILNHIRVMRLNVGDFIVLQNEKLIAKYKISEMKKRSVLLNKVEERKCSQPAYQLVCFICLLKREYMDNSIEKMAEVGVTEIIPVISERSLQKIDTQTLLRYQKKAITGSLQAENTFITQVKSPVLLRDIQTEMKEKIIFYERAEQKCPEISCEKVAFFIGPEGGFTFNELNILKSKGFKTFSPFKSILKAETASVVFAGLLRSEIEKLLL